MSASAKISGVMNKLSAYVAGALSTALPKPVAERAKLHLLDALASMVSGSRLLPGQRAIDYITPLGGTREATVVGTRIMGTASTAAFANGMFAHSDETDDVHQASITHPGATVVPAALALAQRNRDNGTSLLRAMVLGYDVGARLTMSLDMNSFYFVRGHHPPSFGGLFGAAAAAGALLRLSPERVRYMFAYAAQQAAGLSCLFRDPEHIEKAFAMGGMPARNGVDAALFAAHGFTSVPDVFSGDRNFFSAFSPVANPGELTRELGKTYEITRTSIKKWPVGGPILAPLDVTETLMRANPFNANDVKSVVVTLAEDRARIVDNRAMPDICLQHMIAVMLIDGRVTFHSAHDFERMRAPTIVKLRKRVQLVGSPKMADLQRSFQGSVRITLRDGRTLEHYTPAARGSFLNPMTREEVSEKALDLLSPTLGGKRAQLLISTIWKLEKLKDARDLATLCRPS